MLRPLQYIMVALTTMTAARAFSATSTPVQLEQVVKNYFRGVNENDPKLIRSCFGETATIRDVCGINDNVRTVPSSDLVDRCMEFVAAHPDVEIDFHYGPECGRDSNWVVAHWYEIGTWSGNSCGVPAPSPPAPMRVEGQTRFRVDPETLKIQEFVVTRTFTEWESAVLKLRQEQVTPK